MQDMAHRTPRRSVAAFVVACAGSIILVSTASGQPAAPQNQPAPKPGQAAKRQSARQPVPQSQDRQRSQPGDDRDPEALQRGNPVPLAGAPASGQPQNQPQNQAQGQPQGKAQGQAQPPGGTGIAAANAALADGADETVTLSAFSEPVELTTLVEYVGNKLGINITIKGGLNGSVVFNAPVAVKRSNLLKLLDSLLEQQEFTITYDPASDFYMVHPAKEVSVSLVAGEQPSTTRIFATPNMRPSALKTAIEAQLGTLQQQGQAPSGRQIAYVDELGVIVATDTPRKLASIESLIDRLKLEFARGQFIRLELKNVAASVARERALQLVGQTPKGNQFAMNQVQPEQGGQPGVPSSRSGSFDNLGDRLTIDPQGNALIFRGVPEEIEQVRQVLLVIDVPNTLAPETYFAGAAAKQIADIARQRGLGEVITITDTASNPLNNPYGNLSFAIDPTQMGQGQRSGGTAAGGPVMVVDETRGTIIYYGTREQQQQLAALVEKLDTESEKVVIRDYKLKHADAEQVAEILLGLLQNQTPLGKSDLLPDGGGGTSSGISGGAGSQRRRRNYDPSSTAATSGRTQPTPTGASGGDETSLTYNEETFVIANKANNQVLVKAPIKQQEDFSKLIAKLDLRRPQVYLEAKIVSVTWSDSLRLAFETQLVNANGSGGVLNTDFGLGSFPSGSSINSPNKSVPPLAGLSAAIIQSDQVPIIINALETEVNGRVLSTPQLLVNDNEKASLESKDQQPTTRTDLGTSGNPNSTTFDGYVDAGTKLNVTPSISESGLVRLKYEITLSAFTGEGSNGIPPPKLDNTVTADSVTVPSDMTVVLGGITLESKSKTVKKVPLLGDLPLVGFLFQDSSDTDRKTTLYVFLTPRIMRETNFADLRLITEGPQKTSELKSDVPALTPTYIDGATGVPHSAPPAPASDPANVPTQEPATTAAADLNRPRR